MFQNPTELSHGLRQWQPLWQSPGFSIPRFGMLPRITNISSAIANSLWVQSSQLPRLVVSRERWGRAEGVLTVSVSALPMSPRIQVGRQCTHTRARETGCLLRDEDKHGTCQDIWVHREMSAHTRDSQWVNVLTNGLKLLAKWNYV